MKAEPLKEHPSYELFKQTDIVNYHYLQMPRWLLFDRKYKRLSMEARFTYTMLFHRFQLSKLNGWINDDGEVFIIYTRKELAEDLNISEKRVSAAINELKEYELIWERRCGRGFANQIYLANVNISAENAENSLDESLDRLTTAIATDYWVEDDGEIDDAENIISLPRTDKTAGLDKEAPNREEENKNALLHRTVDRSRKNGFFSSNDSETAVLETSNRSFKNSQNGASKTAYNAVQEQPNCPPIYKDFRFIEPNYLYQSQSESSLYADIRVQGGGQTRRNDVDAIKNLIEQAELHVFSENESAVMRDAIERLYFKQSITIGNAIYPNERIREHLSRINALIVEDALNRITNNTTTKIRNSSAYVVTVLFNTIMESGSDLIVDPYLNSLRGMSDTGKMKMGGG